MSRSHRIAPGNGHNGSMSIPEERAGEGRAEAGQVKTCGFIVTGSIDQQWLHILAEKLA